MAGEIGMEPERIRHIYDVLTGLAGERIRRLDKLEKCLRQIEYRDTCDAVRKYAVNIIEEFDELKMVSAAYDRYPDILMAYAGRYEEMTSKAYEVISEITIVSGE